MVKLVLRRWVVLAALLTPVGAVAQTTVAPDLLQETYRDWIVRCETPKSAEGAPAATRICEMAQELSQAEPKQRILTFALQAKPDGTADLTLITPFGLRLSDGIAIDLAAERLIQIGFRTCLPQGCIVSGALDAAMIERLSAGAVATVVMAADAGGQPLALEVSLDGFAAAWARLVALRGS